MVDCLLLSIWLIYVLGRLRPVIYVVRMMTVHLIFCLDVPSHNLSFQLLIKHELDFSSRFYDRWHTGAWLREANDLVKHTCRILFWLRY